MTEKDYFQVGAKLIGLYCLVLMFARSSWSFIHNHRDSR